ncbi:MAG: diguanylate cyclase [Actinobacteria bacterium]|nr:diguanylate cyclase [Actinomycetota bacterium]
MVDSPVLTVVAAACALVAGASSLALYQRACRAERRAAIAVEELTNLRQLEINAFAEQKTVLDPETGLPDIRFFEVVLENRIASARRHLCPVTVVLIDFTPHPNQRLSVAVAAFTALVRQTLREADVVCRIAPRTFALLLEDTNEAGGVWAAERLQVAMAKDPVGAAGLAAGVAGYPTHGLHWTEVLVRARAALIRALAAETGHGLGSVEVATVELS